MSKKKLFVAASIITLIIVAFQIYSLATFDHFKEEGGVIVESTIPCEDVLKEFARESLDFDHVMNAAVRSFKTKGGDFLKIFSEENKKRLKRPLVLLFDYSRLVSINKNSTDDQVVDFLRTEFHSQLERTASYFKYKCEKTLKKSTEVEFDDAELTMSIKVLGQTDSLNKEMFDVADMTLEFYEVLRIGQFMNYWVSARELGEPELENDDDQALVRFSKKTEEKSLMNTVIWRQDGVGVVKAEDKPYVESVMYDLLDEAHFPKNYTMLWSQKEQREDDQDVYFLYAVKVPKSGPRITQKDIQSAVITSNADGESLTLSMNQEGTEKWGRMTEENVDRIIAMCVNDIVLYAPRVIAPIMAGQTQISGPDTETLKNLEMVISGQFPDIVPVDVQISYVKPNPPMLSSTVQIALLIASIVLLVFFAVGYLRNFRSA